MDYESYLGQGIKGSRGCLSVNTSADGPPKQKEVRNGVEAFNRKLEELLRNRLGADRANSPRVLIPTPPRIRSWRSTWD